MSSGYFANQGIDPVNMNFDASTPEKYVSAWPRALEIRTPPPPPNAQQERPGGYVRGRLTFEGYKERLYVSGYPVTDHVTVCLGEKRYSGDPVIFYVTKEYNLRGDMDLFGFLLGLHARSPGRFVFKPMELGFPLVALAEQPAEAYTGPDFNVEMQYIQKRQRNSSGKSMCL